MTDGVKDVLGRYYSEVWGRGDVDACDDLLADDYVDRDPTPGFGTDKAAAKQLVAAVTGGMKDVVMNVDHIIVDGDMAAAHWRLQWTQVGDFMGMVPADGKRLDLRGHDFYRMRGGKIAEIWHCEDFLGVLSQLGVLPT